MTLKNPINAENLLLSVEISPCVVTLLICDVLGRAECVVPPLLPPGHWTFSLALPFGNAAFLCWSRNSLGTGALEESRTVQSRAGDSGGS